MWRVHPDYGSYHAQITLVSGAMFALLWHVSSGWKIRTYPLHKLYGFRVPEHIQTRLFLQRIEENVGYAFLRTETLSPTPGSRGSFRLFCVFLVDFAAARHSPSERAKGTEECALLLTHFCCFAQSTVSAPAPTYGGPIIGVLWYSLQLKNSFCAPAICARRADACTPEISFALLDTHFCLLRDRW